MLRLMWAPAVPSVGGVSSSTGQSSRMYPCMMVTQEASHEGGESGVGRGLIAPPPPLGSTMRPTTISRPAGCFGMFSRRQNVLFFGVDGEWSVVSSPPLMCS